MSLRLTSLLLMMVLLGAMSAGQAATFYWDANGATAGVGGTGNWNTSSSLWRADSDTGALTTFASSTSNVAYLTGTAGTVTVTTGINVNKIFVDATSGNYTITQSSAGNDLNLGGTAPEINVASGETLTMRSFDLVSGTTGDFHKTGAGKVLFTGYADNNFGWRTGQKFVVDEGTTEFATTVGTSNGAFDRAVTFDVNSGAVLLLSATNALGGTSSSITNILNMNGGTLTLNANHYLQTVQMTGGTINGTGTGVSTTAAGGLSLTTSASAVTSTISTGLTLNASSTFTVADGSVNDDLLISGQITGSSGFTKAGTGEAVLTNSSNSYSGVTIVSAGTLNIQSGSALGSTAAGTSVTGGAALEIQGGITVGAEALTLNGTGISSGGVLRNISGNNTYGGLVTLGSATRINSDNAGDTLILSNTGTITGATFGLTVGGVGNTSIASVIGTTSGTLTKDGTGTLTLTGANSYTGVTTVSAGVLNFQHATGLGTTAAGTSVTGGAALEIQGGITVGAEALMLNGTGISGRGALRNISGSNTFAGLVTLGSDTRINSDTVGTTLSLSNTGTITGASFGLTVGGLGDTSIASIIGTTSGTLTKDGTGTLTLNAANTHTGVTTLSNGTLALGNVNTLQNSTLDTTTSSGTKAVTFTVAGTNTYNIGGLAGADDIAIGGNTISVGANNQSNSYTGVISGSGAVAKTGAGTQTVTGNNTYSGGTTISAGTMVSGSRGLGSGNVNVAAYSILSVSQSGSVGLAGQYFNLTPANVSGSDPSFASLGLLQSSLATTNPAQVLNTTTLNFGSGGAGFPSPYNAGASTNFESFYSGKINIGTAGVYTFNTSSDDGSMLFIDGVAIVNNNFHQAITTRTGTVTLTAGYHDIGVGFYQASGVYGLNAQISGPGNTTMVDLNTGNANAQITPDLVIGSLSGAGGVVLATGNLITGQDNTSTTFSGGILGIGGVNKWGTGTQTFSGTNTYTGTTTISAGTLQLGDGTADGLISNSSNISNNAALIYNTVGTQSYTGIISGSGTVTKNGAGEQILTGANSYTGLTTVNAGALNIQHATALGTTAAGTSVTSGAALELEGGITVGAEALTLNGTGVGNGGALRSISGNNTYGGLVTLGSVTRINSETAGQTLTLSNTGTITGATFGLSVGGAGNTNIAGIIGTTSGTLTKDGSGTLTLSGANTFTGATAVNAGRLTLNYATQNNSKLADASALTLGGGVLEMSGGSHTEVVLSTTIGSGVNTVTRSSGSSVLRMNAITRNAGATVNFSAAGIADTDTTNTNGILGAWATINGSDWAMNSTNAANGSITAYTAYADITRRSSGSKVIANTPANNVRIVEGTGTLGNITLAAATTTINTLTQSASGGTSAATIAPAGQTLRLGAVGGILMASGTGGLTIGTSVNDGFLTAGGNTANAAGEIVIQQHSGNSLTINSRIANNGTGVVRVTQSGTGTTVLTGTNTYTGSTTVSGGTLSLSSDANLGAVPGSATADMVVLNGGTLASTANFTLDANRGLTVSAGGGTINTSPGTTLTYNGLVTGSGALIKDGSGTFITGGATFNTHTGPVSINAGTFEIAKTAYVGAIDNNAAVTIATGATLMFNGALTYTQETIGSLSGGGTVDNVGLDNVNFLVGDNNTDTTFSGVLKNTGTKVINLEKRGTGILKLTGTNSYTGSTTVTAGTLQIDGVVTSAVQVNAGATLSGTGSVSKAITINGLGALRPGNKTPTGSGLGIFTLSGSGPDGNLTVATTGTLGLQLGANGIAFAGQASNYYTSPGVLNSSYVNAANIQANANDRILVGGTLSLTGGSIVDVTLSGYTPALGDAYDLLDWGALAMGSFVAGPAVRTGADNALYDLKLPDITAINSGYRWDTSLFATNGIVVVVPEPSRMVLLMAGLSACFLRRRRKQAA